VLLEDRGVLSEKLVERDGDRLLGLSPQLLVKPPQLSHADRGQHSRARGELGALQFPVDLLAQTLLRYCGAPRGNGRRGRLAELRADVIDQLGHAHIGRKVILPDLGLSAVDPGSVIPGGVGVADYDEPRAFPGLGA
jgi:hypothetical protein